MNYFLDQSSCTFKEALTWQLFKDHVEEVRLQTEWQGRIVHLVMAALECLPVISQIVSLIELGVIRFFVSFIKPTLPITQSLDFASEPTSIYPQVELIETSYTDLHKIFWPTNLETLGINEEEKEKIDKAIEDIFAEYKTDPCVLYSVECSKKQLSYHSSSRKQTITIDLPRSLYFDQKKSQFILLSKKKFKPNSNAERKITWAYCLSTGKFLFKKRHEFNNLYDKEHDTEYRLVLNIRETKDIAQSYFSKRILAVSTPSSTEPQTKTQFIETVKSGDLSILFNTQILQNFEVKYQLCQDLMSDLKKMYQEVSPFFMSDEDCPDIQKGGPLFHQDIKIENFLVFKDIHNKWRLELSDFGIASGNYFCPIYSVGFTPPEYVQLYKEIFLDQEGFSNSKFSNSTDPKKLANFNLSHGIQRDYWALGLILLSIIVGKIEKINWEYWDADENTWKQDDALIAPLNCLKACMPIGRIGKEFEEEKILTLTQTTLDRELRQLKKQVRNLHPDYVEQVEEIFYLITRLLKIKPESRR